MRRTGHAIVAALLASSLVGCTTTNAPPPVLAATETPASLVAQGDTALQRDDLAAADSAYARALSMDPRYLPALAGQANLAKRSGFYERGFAAVERGIEAANTQADRSRFRALQIELNELERKEGWYDRSRDIFDRAVRQDRSAERDTVLLLAIGRVALAGYRRDDSKRMLDDAREFLTRTVEIGGDARADALRLLAEVDGIERARIGGGEVKSIAAKPALTRGDVAWLLANEYRLAAAFAGHDLKTVVAAETAQDGSSDFAHLPYAETVRQLQRIGIRSLAVRGGRFNPDATVSREEFALLLEDLIAKQGRDATVTRKFIGSASPFADLPASRASFNAMMTAVSRGLMSADADGNVRPTAPLDGGTAILALRGIRVS